MSSTKTADGPNKPPPLSSIVSAIMRMIDFLIMNSPFLVKLIDKRTLDFYNDSEHNSIFYPCLTFFLLA